jgi:hypothetical protein
LKTTNLEGTDGSLTPVILATREREIRRIMVRSQPGQTVYKTLSQQNLHKKKKKKRAGGVAHLVGPEFKLHYWEKKIKTH